MADDVEPLIVDGDQLRIDSALQIGCDPRVQAIARRRLQFWSGILGKSTGSASRDDTLRWLQAGISRGGVGGRCQNVLRIGHEGDVGIEPRSRHKVGAIADQVPEDRLRRIGQRPADDANR